MKSLHGLFLKKPFLHHPVGSQVLISDISNELGEGNEVFWYNVVDKFGTHTKLGNSLTMNVDEWIGENKPREWYLGIAHNGEGAFAHRIINNVPHEYGMHMAGLKEIIRVREIL